MTASERRYAAVFVLGFVLILGIFLFLGIDLEGVITAEHHWALLVFFLVTVTEVILAPIPGGVTSILGAATFGFWKAWPILYLGNIIGSGAVFLIARHLGRDTVRHYLDAKKLARYERWLQRHPRAVWVVYAVPILPVDLVSILLGLSRVRFRQFMVIVVGAMWLYTGIVAGFGAFAGQYVPYLETIGIAVLFAFIAAVMLFLYSLRKR